MRLSNSTMVSLKKKSWNFKQIGQNGCVNIHEKNTFFIKNTASGLKRARIFFITFSKKSILFITLFAFLLTINFQKRHLNTKNVIGHPDRSAKLVFFSGSAVYCFLMVPRYFLNHFNRQKKSAKLDLICVSLYIFWPAKTRLFLKGF